MKYNNKTLFALPKDRRGHFIFTNPKFHIHEFTIITSWIHFFYIRNSRVNDFSFMNSLFQLKLHLRFQLHEFTISTSWTHWNREFAIVNSWIWNCEFVKLKSWNHEDEIGNLWSWNVPIGPLYSNDYYFLIINVIKRCVIYSK
jgi:hypothetical protein